MYKKILAPLDGSELSECSLEHVAAVAKGCAVPGVVLLHIIEPPTYTAYAVISQEILSDILRKSKTKTKRYMAKAVAKLKKNGINAKTVIIEGMPSDEILNYTEKNQVDLIIMSTHGSSGLTRWAFGSVTDKVMRNSPVPVLVIAPPGCRK